MTIHNSKIYIVGAGPGDPELITVKGLKAVQKADVILYDALVNIQLLNEAPESSLKIFVGKRAGKPCIKQEDINKLIKGCAEQYQTVVRLKGGDPYIFGRGHEELQYLQNQGMTAEVIPGISSSCSLPLLQGVPVTSRGISESFWVLTGSTKDHTLSKDIKLAAQSTATMVILMGIRKIELIRNILIQEGKFELPAMVIQSGSTKTEKVVVGTIDTIANQVRENKIGTPGIIVIGEVVAHHPEFIKQKALKEWAA